MQICRGNYIHSIVELLRKRYVERSRARRGGGLIDFSLLVVVCDTVVNTNIKSVLPELPTRAPGCFLLGLLYGRRRVSLISRTAL